MTKQQTTTRPRQQGMTLTEILVVIAIITVVMGLVLGGVSAMRQGASRSHAKTLLTGLSGYANSYEVSTGTGGGNGVNHLTGKGMVDWNNSIAMNSPARAGTTGSLSDASRQDNDDIAGEANDYTTGDGTYPTADNDTDMQWANIFIERFIWAANQMPAIRNGLPSLGTGFDDTELVSNVPEGDGFMEVVDPWGNSIAYAQGVSHSDTNTEDDFLPEREFSFFASAGPDQKWGRFRKYSEFSSDAAWNTYRDSDEYKYTLDNIYSFESDQPTTGD